MKISREEIETIKDVANQNIHDVLDALDIDYNDNFKNITAPCPIHDGDRMDAWSWSIRLGLFQCFSRGCHNKYGKDIYGLVRGVKDCGFYAAVDFVKNVCAGNMPTNAKAAGDVRANKKFVEQINRKKVQKKFSDDLLKILTYNRYLETRGYPKDLVCAYGAGLSPPSKTRMSNRIIFPVRNVDNEIVGFTGRTILDNWKELKIGKWEHNAGFDKEHSLFNINNAAKHIGETGIAILTEGPLDVLRLEQAGIHNGVAIFGRKLHNGQISMLMSAGANHIIIALDADEAGKTGAESALKIAGAFFKVSIVDLKNGDVGDLSVEGAREIFNEICN